MTDGGGHSHHRTYRYRIWRIKNIALPISRADDLLLAYMLKSSAQRTYFNPHFSISWSCWSNSMLDSHGLSGLPCGTPLRRLCNLLPFQIGTRNH